MLIKVSKHVPKTPSTFSTGYNRTAKNKPQRWAVIGNIRTLNATLKTFRHKRKQLLKQAKRDVGKFKVVKHSIWPRSYGYEYFIHLQESKDAKS